MYRWIQLFINSVYLVCCSGSARRHRQQAGRWAPASLWIVLQAKTWACIISSCACYLLLPGAPAYNAPPPSAPHAERFYCFHKFCMIHIRSSPLFHPDLSLCTTSLALSGHLWRLSRAGRVDVLKHYTSQRFAVGSWGCWCHWAKRFHHRSQVPLSSAQCSIIRVKNKEENLMCEFLFLIWELNYKANRWSTWMKVNTSWLVWQLLIVLIWVFTCCLYFLYNKCGRNVRSRRTFLILCFMGMFNLCIGIVIVSFTLGILTWVNSGCLEARIGRDL